MSETKSDSNTEELREIVLQSVGGRLWLTDSWKQTAGGRFRSFRFVVFFIHLIIRLYVCG